MHWFTSQAYARSFAFSALSWFFVNGFVLGLPRNLDYGIMLVDFIGRKWWKTFRSHIKFIICFIIIEHISIDRVSVCIQKGNKEKERKKLKNWWPSSLQQQLQQLSWTSSSSFFYFSKIYICIMLRWWCNIWNGNIIDMNWDWLKICFWLKWASGAACSSSIHECTERANELILS